MGRSAGSQGSGIQAKESGMDQPKQETIQISSAPSPVESKPKSAQERVRPKTEPSVTDKNEAQAPTGQISLTDFGLYKCEVCGKMVMGYEKENHEREKHGVKSVEWKKIR